METVPEMPGLTVHVVGSAYRLPFPVWDVVAKGVMFNVGPWHCTPPPKPFVMYGPCNTCTAWFVTEPELTA